MLKTLIIPVLLLFTCNTVFSDEFYNTQQRLDYYSYSKLIILTLASYNVNIYIDNHYCGMNRCLKQWCRRQCQPTSQFPEMSTISWQRSTLSHLHALDTATSIVLISITYQSHRASKHSAAGKMVVRTQSPPNKSAWPSPDPDSNSGLKLPT